MCSHQSWVCVVDKRHPAQEDIVPLLGGGGGQVSTSYNRPGMQSPRRSVLTGHEEDDHKSRLNIYLTTFYHMMSFLSNCPKLFQMTVSHKTETDA